MKHPFQFYTPSVCIFFSLFSFIKIFTFYHYACFCLHLTVLKGNLMAIVELTFFWSVLGLANIRVMFLKYSKKSCKKTKQNKTLLQHFHPKHFEKQLFWICGKWFFSIPDGGVNNKLTPCRILCFNFKDVCPQIHLW